jgi:5'-deoxynucleotidase YfbR-like HD superfamily hydrolase
METIRLSKIDLINAEEALDADEPNKLLSTANVAFQLGGLAIRFAQVDRTPRYTETSRENDAEHSFMLALVANELSALLYPDLNTGKVSQYAIVHDLIETITGDVATFQLTAEELAAKQQAEHNALDILLKSLPPYTAQLLRSYELQDSREARFVKAVDKLLPVITDIIGPGAKVMTEDYGVTTIEKLRISHNALHARIATGFEEFPSIVSAHRVLCDLFETEFEQQLLC